MRYLLLILAMLSVAGCATQAQYSPAAVGQVNRTISAVVISARQVAVGGTTAVGGAAGVGVGALTGSSMGSGGRANAVGAIGGAVIGGLVGAALESEATKSKAMEYVVETSNGNLMTIVQSVEGAFTVGAKVFVLYGSPSRLIADPRR